MRCAHSAKILEKCGNMQNMRQSHIYIKLTCLAMLAWYMLSSYVRPSVCLSVRPSQAAVVSKPLDE